MTTYCVLLATRQALDNPAKKSAIYDLVDRLAKAGDWVQANADTYVQNYFVEFQHQDPAGAKEGYRRSGPPLWTAPSTDLIAHQRTQAKLLVSVGVLPKGFDPDDQFDASVTQEVRKVLQPAGTP